MFSKTNQMAENLWLRELKRRSSIFLYCYLVIRAG